MNERQRQFTREIASLQLRVDQLNSTFAASERVLSTLSTQAEAALSVSDETGAARLARKMAQVRHRSLAVTNEIGTLQELIAARRHLGDPPSA
jgi:hypothetical protein